jgi:hypothetical protein
MVNCGLAASCAPGETQRAEDSTGIGKLLPLRRDPVPAVVAGGIGECGLQKEHCQGAEPRPDVHIHVETP